jgi:hypothetical protein
MRALNKALFCAEPSGDVYYDPRSTVSEILPVLDSLQVSAITKFPPR